MFLLGEVEKWETFFLCSLNHSIPVSSLLYHLLRIQVPCNFVSFLSHTGRWVPVGRCWPLKQPEDMYFCSTWHLGSAWGILQSCHPLSEYLWAPLFFLGAHNKYAEAIQWRCDMACRVVWHIPVNCNRSWKCSWVLFNPGHSMILIGRHVF